MHAVNERHSKIKRMLRHGFIGDEHEFFNHAVGDAAHRHGNIRCLSCLVQRDLRLIEIKIDAAPLYTLRIEQFHQRAHLLKHRDDIRIFFAQSIIAVKNGVHIVIRHAVRRFDDGLRETVRHDLSVLPDLHEAGDRQLFRALGQRAYAVAHLRREHRQHAIREIHAGAAFISVRIQRRSGLHIVTYIRDMHAKQPTVLQLHKRYRIVKVLRIRAVNGDDKLAAQILAPRDRIRIDRLVQTARLPHGGF